MTQTRQGFDKPATNLPAVFGFTVAAVTLAIVVGACSFVFLEGLEMVTSWRARDSKLVLLAPVVGLWTALCYTRVSPASSAGGAVLASILRRDRGEYLPRLYAPLIVVSTWLSHLAGLSVGREGTAVQMGGGIADLLRRLFRIRQATFGRWLLQMGIAAGFGSVFGVPVAGAVFALEFSGDLNGARRPKGGARDWRDMAAIGLFCLLSSFVADLVARAFGSRHAVYPLPAYSEILTVSGIAALVAAILLFIVCAATFVLLLHGIRRIWNIVFRRQGLRPVIGGLLYAPLAFAPAFLLQYAGLGTELIQQAFHQPAKWYDPLLKIAFTTFSLGADFRGGEVTPLFFIGATAGSFVGSSFALSPATLAAPGLVAVFGAVAGVPIASAVMCGEIFGWPSFLVALLVCLATRKALEAVTHFLKF